MKDETTYSTYSDADTVQNRVRYKQTRLKIQRNNWIQYHAILPT